MHRAIAALPTPISLFSGLRIRDALAPDNIILFKRTHTRALRPEGVSNNYHHRFELVVVLDRAGPMRVGNASHLLHPGEAMLIFPNQFHHYLDVAEGELEWLFVTFELANGSTIGRLRDRPRVLDQSCLGTLRLIVQQYLAEGPVDTLTMSHHLAELLRAMTGMPRIDRARCDIRSADNARDVLLERINAFVRANLGRQLSLADLAVELGYSASYMRAVFRSRFGISLGRYIRESRLSLAAHLLQTTSLSITEIAARSGFDSLFAFSRAFKNAYGISPKLYGRMVSNP